MIADIVRLFTSTAVVQIMTLIRNLAVARLLSPDIAGACISWLALPQAGAYCSLGLVDALPFLVPYHRGRHGKEDVESVKNQVWTLHGLVSFGVMILAVVGVWVFPFASGEMRLFGLLACGLFGINQLSKFAVMELAAEHRFDLLSRTEVLYAALLLVTSVVGMAAWHGTGFWGALMLSNAAVVGYVYRRQLRHERIRWVQPDWTVLRGLVPTGIVMAVAATIYLPFVLIARLSVASVLGVQAAGHFFLASVLMTFLAVVPRTLARVMLPHLSLSYGGGQSLRETLPVFAKIQIASLGITIGGAGLGSAALVWLVPVWFPDYREGVQPAMLALVACLPYSLIDNANSLLVMAGRQRLVLQIFGLMLGVQTASLIGLWVTGMSLQGVAATLFVTFSLYALLVNLRAVQIGRGRSGLKAEGESPSYDPEVEFVSDALPLRD